MRSNIGLLPHPNAATYKYLPCVTSIRRHRSHAVFGRKLTILKLSAPRGDRRVSKAGRTEFVRITYENSRRLRRVASRGARALDPEGFFWSKGGGTNDYRIVRTTFRDDTTLVTSGLGSCVAVGVTDRENAWGIEQFNVVRDDHGDLDVEHSYDEWRGITPILSLVFQF
jgi:hypothetical protein